MFSVCRNNYFINEFKKSFLVYSNLCDNVCNLKISYQNSNLIVHKNYSSSSNFDSKEYFKKFYKTENKKLEIIRKDKNVAKINLRYLAFYELFHKEILAEKYYILKGFYAEHLIRLYLSNGLLKPNGLFSNSYEFHKIKPMKELVTNCTKKSILFFPENNFPGFDFIIFDLSTKKLQLFQISIIKQGFNKKILKSVEGFSNDLLKYKRIFEWNPKIDKVKFIFIFQDKDKFSLIYKNIESLDFKNIHPDLKLCLKKENFKLVSFETLGLYLDSEFMKNFSLIK